VKKNLLKIGLLALLLSVIGVVVFLVRQRQIFQNRASANTVLVTIAPNSATLPATVKVYVDSQGERLVFARVAINFDKTKLKLVSDPMINPKFGNEVRKSTMAQANATGQIELIAGVNPPAAPVTVAAEFATLMFDKNDTTVVAQANNVSFLVAGSQFVASPEKLLTINATGARLQTAVIADTQAPETSITAPVSGNTVRGLVSVLATATDNVGVSKVELFVDAAKLDTDLSSPYSFNWETSGVTNGSHSLMTKAYDSAGNVKTSSAVVVSVSNASVADTTAPTISITAPSGGSQVNGTISVSASASDNVGVTKVEFYVDLVNKGTDQTSPYSFSWNTATVTNGAHTLLSKAYDGAGNVRTSTIVNVAVSNTTASGFRCTVLGDPSCYESVVDGEINIYDWPAFSSRYGATVDPGASCTAAGQLACINCNSDSMINIFDFSCFARAYLKRF
jgi:hypothetical protein